MRQVAALHGLFGYHSCTKAKLAVWLRVPKHDNFAKKKMGAWSVHVSKVRYSTAIIELVLLAASETRQRGDAVAIQAAARRSRDLRLARR